MQDADVAKDHTGRLEVVGHMLKWKEIILVFVAYEQYIQKWRNFVIKGQYIGLGSPNMLKSQNLKVVWTLWTTNKIEDNLINSNINLFLNQPIDADQQ